VSRPIFDDPQYEAWYNRLPSVKQEQTAAQLDRLKIGVHTLAPMTCPGAKSCKFIDHCPIPGRNAEGALELGPDANYPIGRSCVLERLYVQERIQSYYDHLKVQPGNPVEGAVVNDLALIDMYKNRLLMILGQGSRDFIQTDIKGYTDNGRPMYETALHPGIDMLDRLEKRRQQLLDRLIETRKAKADLQLKTGALKEKDMVLEQLMAVRRALEAQADKQVSEGLGLLPLTSRPVVVDEEIPI